MYKKLTRQEEKIIRETQEHDSAPASGKTIAGNTVWFVVIFAVFVLVAYQVLKWMTSAAQ